MRLSGKAQKWLERAEKGDCLVFIVVRMYGWHDSYTYTGWRLCGLHFPLVPKEGVPVLSYQLAQMWERRGKESGVT